MRPGERRAVLSEINVTPFVDVTLVLLIIFMVTAPFLRQGIEVTLPKAATSERVAHGSPLVLTLTKEHLIYFQRGVVTRAELRQILRGYANTTPVTIEADRYAYVSKLIELWDLCREAGFRTVHIATLAD